MNEEEINKKIKSLMDKITNPLDRDRICLHCDEPFFANKSDKFYCSDKCYQSHYNERVRPRKDLEKIFKDFDLQQEEKEKLINSFKTHENLLRRNIEIIGYLTIDPLVGTDYKEVQLREIGINFEVYDYREKVANTKDSFELIIGNYRLTLINDQTIKISKNTQS